MLNELITRKKNQWLRSDTCPVNALSSYIRKQGYLRETQVEAIETYLYLKIEGSNKPLWELFSENFFTDDIDLNSLNINQETRKFLQKNTNANALYGFSTLGTAGWKSAVTGTCKADHRRTHLPWITIGLYEIFFIRSAMPTTL